MIRKVIPTPEQVKAHYTINESTPRRTMKTSCIIERKDIENMSGHNYLIFNATKEEQFYLDKTVEAIKRFDELETLSQIVFYLEGGYHYGAEPSDTIPEACENLLLDLGLSVPWEC